MDEAKGFAEAERVMGANAGLVFQFGVAGDFGQAARGGPTFGGGDEFAADAGAAQISIDKPAFDVADAFGHGAIDAIADGEFDEAAEAAVGATGNEHGGVRAVEFLASDFEGVHFVGAIGPKLAAHAEPFGAVFFAQRGNHAQI